MTNKKRAFAIIIVIILSMTAVGLVAATVIPTADQLLTRSLETLETMTDGHAIVEVTTDLPEQSMSGTFEVWVQLNAGPNGEPAMRVEVLAASEVELVGVTAVSDGTQFWLYDPNRNVVVVGRAEDMAAALAAKLAGHEGEWRHEGDFDPESMDIPETPAEAVAKLLEYFTAERNGSAQIAGSEAHQLRLIPIPDRMPEEMRLAGGFVNLWLRSSDQLPLAVEYAQSALGYGRVEATLAEINIGLDSALFTFEIPEGAEIIQAAELMAQMEAMETEALPADFTLLAPTDLPEGATAGESQLVGGAVVQRFNLADGRSFYVAQGAAMPLDAPAEATSRETVTVRGVEGVLFTNGEVSRTLLAWREREISFLIGGDLTPEQALAVAESLQ
jgi:outer membrane lipoprotein-sorting protein